VAIIVATLLLFLAGPFVLWPLLKTPPEVVDHAQAPPGPLSGPTSPRGGEVR
jgi:hypothetical protein